MGAQKSLSPMGTSRANCRKLMAGLRRIGIRLIQAIAEYDTHGIGQSGAPPDNNLEGPDPPHFLPS